MAWYPARGGGIPASVKTDMNAVLNKKFGTQGETYPPKEWAEDVNLMGVLPTRTATGAIANFTDGADDVPIVEGVFEFNPYQEGSGDPSPSNKRVIHGYTGLKIGYVDFNQLLDKDNYPSSTGIFTNNGDGSWTANGTASTTEAVVIETLNDKMVSGHKYFVGSGLETVGSSSTFEFMILRFFPTSNLNVYNEATIAEFQPPAVGAVQGQLVVRRNTTVSNLDFVPQLFDLNQMFGDRIADYLYTLEQNETGKGVELFRQLFPKSYYGFSAGGTKVTVDSVNGEPTCPNASVSWLSEGTKYGGSYNSESGVLTVTPDDVMLGSLLWNKASGYYYSTSLRGLVKPEGTGLCETLKNAQSGDNTFRFTNNGDIIVISATYNAMTKEEFIEDVANVKLVYELENPVEIELEPTEIRTLYGTNNIYHDANGNSAIDFRADINLLLASLQGNRGLQMMMATPTEETEQTEEVEENEDER